MLRVTCLPIEFYSYLIRKLVRHIILDDASEHQFTVSQGIKYQLTFLTPRIRFDQLPHPTILRDSRPRPNKLARSQKPPFPAPTRQFSPEGQSKLTLRKRSEAPSPQNNRNRIIPHLPASSGSWRGMLRIALKCRAPGRDTHNLRNDSPRGKTREKEISTAPMFLMPIADVLTPDPCGLHRPLFLIQEGEEKRGGLVG